MKQIVKAIVSREPVMTMAVLQSGLGLAMSFGVNISAAQMAAILTFTASMLGWVLRAYVSPNVEPKPWVKPKDGGVQP